MRLKIIFLVIAFLMVGCTSNTPTTPSATPADPISDHDFLPNLADLFTISEIRSISIQDDWAGLIDYGPTLSYYSLMPNGSEFTGLVNFTVGGDFNKRPISETNDLHIPTKGIEAFLKKLASTSYRKGKYEPFEQWTDDYPSLEIRVLLRHDEISFHTTSQGEYHTPWAMIYLGQTFVVDSATPMDALKVLLPYLKKDRLAALEDQVLKEPYDNGINPNPTNEPTPTPPP
jgi:hypothetical protein